MKTAPLPDNEYARLATLREFGILDTEPDVALDSVVELAAYICQAPISAISLIDENRQWFKAIIGLDVSETSRDVAFCSHTILQNEIMIVPDAQNDERFFDNPLVTSSPEIRFYAGVPLVASNGHRFGTLCVIDRIPRELGRAQLDALKTLSNNIMAHLNLRLAHKRVRQEIEEREQFKRQLSELAKMQKAILDGANYSIISVSTDGIITSFNKAAERMLGYAAAEIIGKANPQLIHLRSEIYNRAQTLSEELGFEVTAGFESFVAKARLTGESDTHEWTYVRKDGTRFPVLLSVSALSDGQEVTGFLGIAKDLSEKKHLSEQLAQEKSLRNALVREVHHRIKNNLQGVTEVMSQYAETHKEIAEPLNQAISQLQSIAVIHGLQGRASLNKVRLCELTAAIAAANASMWKKSVAVEIPECWIPCTISEIEAVPIALILNELITNAIKHGAHDENVRIALAHEPLPESIRLTIYNRGSIPVDFGLKTADYFGTGLQLAYSLLPRDGAKLGWTCSDGLVTTTLELESPIIYLES